MEDRIDLPTAHRFERLGHRGSLEGYLRALEGVEATCEGTRGRGVVFVHDCYGHIGRESSAHHVEEHEGDQERCSEDGEEVYRARREVAEFAPQYGTQTCLGG